MYQITIKDGILESVSEDEEINIETIKCFVYVGKEKEHARIEFVNGEKLTLLKEELKIKHV